MKLLLLVYIVFSAIVFGWMVSLDTTFADSTGTADCSICPVGTNATCSADCTSTASYTKCAGVPNPVDCDWVKDDNGCGTLSGGGNCPKTACA